APVQGDANLDQIADVVHLLDTFFAGAPAPKGLFGYTDNLARDVLEDLKKDFFEEVDAMQDLVARNYQSGFALHLLLRGRNPDAYTYTVEFAERVTETPNQRADLALKYQALGLPRSMVWDSAGVDVAAAERAKKDELRERGPYPEDGGDAPPEGDITPGTQPRVAVTPGNGRKGESDTTITTRH
ncbi:MAG TPA: hypothetical protein VFL78_10720, partial [Rhodanobacteraceae bacterium]|nr:hypothetical protein [Rhodanobacteraceae bacterium]